VKVNFFDAERMELHNLCKLIWHATAYVVNSDRNYCDRKGEQEQDKKCLYVEKNKREIVLLLLIYNSLKSQ